MISEKTFSGQFSGFWSEHLPFLTPQAVSEINMTGTAVKNRVPSWAGPMMSNADNSYNDVIAETAFGLFAESIKRKQIISELLKDIETVSVVQRNAVQRVSGLRRDGDAKPFEGDSSAEQAASLAIRLESYFVAEGFEKLLIQPRFRGCGIVDSCYGDILAQFNLIELKMADRNLRSADIRQILTYCALNYHSGQYEIEEVTILNPRRGSEHRFFIEELAKSMAGTTAAELFHQITSFLANFETVHQPS